MEEKILVFFLLFHALCFLFTLRRAGGGDGEGNKGIFSLEHDSRPLPSFLFDILTIWIEKKKIFLTRSY